MKRAIIYGRVSTNKQSVESIETQIAECEKWAERNNCRIVDIYDDSGQSGRDYNVHNREGFQQIKEDARLGRMDYALIYRIDRFSRSVKDYFNNESILEEYGVKVIVVSMPFLNEADIVVKALYVAMAEQFSKSLSEDVYTKMRTFANKKAFLGGKPPYGFRLVEKDGNKTFEIHEEEAAGIRLAYELYLGGLGYINVSKRLASMGYLNELNEPFTPSHVAKMLKSKKYNGWYVFGMREKVNGKDVKTKDEEKIIEIPNVYPKIIDDQTFQQMQNRLSKNIVRNKTKVRNYPLTGLIVCGECGRAVTGACTSNKNRKVKYYSYYKCTGRKVNGCTVKSIRADFLEDLIIDKIQAYAFNDEFVKNLIAEVQGNLFIDVDKFVKTKKQLEKQIEATNDKIKEATKDKYSKIISEEIYKSILIDFNKEKETLELKLSNVTEQLNINDKTTAIYDYVEWLRNNLKKSHDDIKQTVLSQAVQSIVLFDDKVEIYLNIAGINVNKKRVESSPNINNGEPLSILDRQKKHQENVSSNINNGVPLSALNKKAYIYVANGVSAIGFSKSI